MRMLLTIHRAAEKEHSRKGSFVLCNHLRHARSMCYTGLHSSSVCSPGFLEEFFSETQVPLLVVKQIKKVDMSKKATMENHLVERKKC
jgi:hypothetical protein